VVEKFTGLAPRQTVPDPVVHAAGEVELVDLAPEALRDRMTRGHIYPPREAEAALGGCFRIGNLSMLRELALLWLAAKLASDPQRYRPTAAIPAAVTPGSGWWPEARRRHPHRSAGSAGSLWRDDSARTGASGALTNCAASW
jgi:hypothetical protein